MGAIAAGILAGIFLPQGISGLAHNDALTGFAFQVMGQQVEGVLLELFMAWCVIVLIADKQARGRILVASTKGAATRSEAAA